jgi:pimeloyl-ACP methyl ester carboxylesterase
MKPWNLRQSYAYPTGTIRYDVFGQGPPLVLVHGTPFSSYVWRKIVPALSQHWTVYVYDLLGYGASDKPAGQDVSLAAQTHVLTALLDHWRLERPAIVGHDFGGATVLRTHLLHHRDFSRIALMDPVALAPWGIAFDRHVRQYEAAFRDLPADFHRALVATYIQEAAYRGLDDATLAAYIEPWLGPEGQAGFYSQISQFDLRYTNEIEPLYAGIKRPVFILWGADDVWLPFSQGQRLHQLIAGSEFHPVPRAGHLVQEDAPEVVSAALTEFFLRPDVANHVDPPRGR